MLPIASLVVGIAVGLLVKFNVTPEYSPYLAIAILAAMDSVFGGITANLSGKFNMLVFISGFFGNALIAAALTYIGKKLGVDLYLAAIFVFGSRLFNNFAIIRRILIDKFFQKAIE